MKRKQCQSYIEVDHWIAQDSALLGIFLNDDDDKPYTIRMKVLQRLIAYPTIWYRQLLNFLGGCLRLIGLVIVGISALNFFSILTQLDGATPTSYWMVIFYSVGVLVFIDGFMLDRRISGWRDVFTEHAERVARVVCSAQASRLGSPQALRS